MQSAAWVVRGAGPASPCLFAWVPLRITPIVRVKLFPGM